jgi:hypothetical protein
LTAVDIPVEEEIKHGDWVDPAHFDRLEWMLVKEPAGQYIYIYPAVDVGI